MFNPELKKEITNQILEFAEFAPIHSIRFNIRQKTEQRVISDNYSEQEVLNIVPCEIEYLFAQIETIDNIPNLSILCKSRYDLFMLNIEVKEGKIQKSDIWNYCENLCLKYEPDPDNKRYETRIKFSKKTYQKVWSDLKELKRNNCEVYEYLIDRLKMIGVVFPAYIKQFRRINICDKEFKFGKLTICDPHRGIYHFQGQRISLKTKEDARFLCETIEILGQHIYKLKNKAD